MDRCESTWRQLPSMPVIRCARRAGHPNRPDWPDHWNTRERRQWTQNAADRQAAEGRA